MDKVKVTQHGMVWLMGNRSGKVDVSCPECDTEVRAKHITRMPHYNSSSLVAHFECPHCLCQFEKEKFEIKV